MPLAVQMTANLAGTYQSGQWLIKRTLLRNGLKAGKLAGSRRGQGVSVVADRHPSLALVGGVAFARINACLKGAEDSGLKFEVGGRRR